MASALGAKIRRHRRDVKFPRMPSRLTTMPAYCPQNCLVVTMWELVEIGA